MQVSGAVAISDALVAEATRSYMAQQKIFRKASSRDDGHEAIDQKEVGGRLMGHGQDDER
jgi:hypothetical protein